jgi:O-methyltransferase involved in polyketide biosynthesis
VRSSLPAIVASTGVSMYLTREAIVLTLRQVAALAPGSSQSRELDQRTVVSHVKARPIEPERYG